MTSVMGTPVNLKRLAEQYKGRRFAELILRHVKSSNEQSCMNAMAGLMAELPANLVDPVANLVDVYVGMTQEDARKFFAGDCGETLDAIVSTSSEFLRKNYQIEIDANQAFTIFTILTENWAYACLMHPSTKAAMKKAAGVGFLGRLLGG